MRDLKDPALLLAILRRFGSHSLAYSTLQPRMRYWGSDSGYTAYRRTLGQYTFLGDPICADDALEFFLAQTVAAFPNALFMQIHQPAATILRNHGYYITPVGVESDIATDSFSLTGKRMADVRHYRNKARAGGVRVQEVADSPTLRAMLRPVSDAWLPRKSWFLQELEFLARPYVASPEPDVRIFTGVIDGQVVGFVILDPMYRSSAVTGYTVTILRHYPDAPEGTVDFIILEAIECLAREGGPTLSLGVSPFHKLETLSASHGKGSVPVYWLYRGLRRWGTPIYHFRGLSFHKSRYRAPETPVFTAVPSALGLWPVYASARACKML